VAAIAFDSPKNYQLWHHRRVLVGILNELGVEMEVTAEILKKDPKNYHVWVHRQWVLKKFNCFENELDFVDSLLKDDLRNNSAWNQRHFAVEQTTGFTSTIIEREIKYTTKYILKALNNESPWNYLIGLLEKKGFNDSHAQTLEAFSLELIHKDSHCTQAYSFLIELYDKNSTPEKLIVAVQYCERLSGQVDPIRHLYWDYRREDLLGKLKKQDSKYDTKDSKKTTISLSAESRKKDKSISTPMSSISTSSTSSSTSPSSSKSQNKNQSIFSPTTISFVVFNSTYIIFME